MFAEEKKVCRKEIFAEKEFLPKKKNFAEKKFLQKKNFQKFFFFVENIFLSIKKNLTK